MDTVLIADDHGIVRRGLEIMVKEVFGGKCTVRFAANGREVMAMLKEYRFDMLIIDANMSDANALELLPRIMALAPDIRTLVVSVGPENVYAPRFLRAGALGYACKDIDDNEMCEAIRCVGTGKRYLTESLSRHFAEAILNKSPENPFDQLSAREFEVALLLLKGHGAIEVGNALSISSSTASSYRFRIFEKLAIKSVMDLNRLARQFGLIRD